MARLGLGPGWSCLYANDFDPVKAATYRDNFPEAHDHFHEGDIWAVKPVELPGRADLAWASSPCQDFSLAGNRAGLEGGRSSAFFGFWRLMEALEAEGRAPRVVVIENVVGLLTSNGGKDFEALCRALAAQGYRFGALEIDAARFTPQSRPRVFVVAAKVEPPARLAGRGAFHTRAVVEAQHGLPVEKIQEMLGGLGGGGLLGGGRRLFSGGLGHGLRVFRSLRACVVRLDQTASAPEMISISSLVI